MAMATAAMSPGRNLRRACLAMFNSRHGSERVFPELDLLALVEFTSCQLRATSNTAAGPRGRHSSMQFELPARTLRRWRNAADETTHG